MLSQKTGHTMAGLMEQALLMTETTTDLIDPRPLFGHAIATGSDVIAAVRPDQLPRRDIGVDVEHLAIVAAAKRRHHLPC